MFHSRIGTIRLATATAVLCAVAGLALSPVEEADAQPSRPPSKATSQPARSVCFILAADTHCGPPDVAARNPAIIREMNTVAGKPWPKALGGKVAPVRGVAIAGDLTDKGTEAEWDLFKSLYGWPGTQGRLKLPLYVGTGNHDRHKGSRIVTAAVAKRYGALQYSWDFDDVHVVCLDLWASGAALKFLRKDLAGVDRKRPVILFAHYPFAYKGQVRRSDAALLKIIANYNVIAIAYGHTHGWRVRKFRGYNVLNIPSVRTKYTPGFYVVEVRNSTLRLGVRVPGRGWRWARDLPFKHPTTQPATRPTTQKAVAP